MGFNIKMNVLDGKVEVTLPPMFFPHRLNFASMANSKSSVSGYGSLVQQILARFPFVTKAPGFHPALRYNFQAIKTARGVLFRYKLKRVEEQFHQLVKESSRQKDMEFRKLARRLFLIIERELHAQRLLDSNKRRYFKFFEDRADLTVKQRREFLITRYEKMVKYAERLREKYAEIDREKTEYIIKFWKDFDKNREIKPRVISIGGASLQSILNELPWTEGSSLWRVFELVKENQMNLYSERIVENCEGGLPPELLGKHIYFNKKIWEQVQRKLKKIQLYEGNRDNNISYMDERRERSKIDYNKFVDNTIQRQDDFISHWDHLNQELPAKQSFSNINLTTALSQYRKTSPSIIHAFQERTKDSFLIARADSFIGYMSHSIPSEVLFNYGVFHPYRLQRKPYDPLDKKAILQQKDQSEKFDKIWTDKINQSNQIKDTIIENKIEYDEESNEKRSKRIQTNFEIKRDKANAYSARTDDVLIKDRAPRFNPEQSERKRKIAQSQFPKYEEVLQFSMSFADDRDRSELINSANFHALKRNEARLEDHKIQTDETVRQKADWHNERYKEKSGSTDAYFRNRWNSNHNEALIPVNYQDQALLEAVKPIRDNSDTTPISEGLKTVAKTYSPDKIQKFKKK